MPFTPSARARKAEAQVPNPGVCRFPPWTEPGLLDGDCLNRCVSCVSSSCRASVGFLTRYYEELMEPLVQCQVSQVSMRLARGSQNGFYLCSLFVIPLLDSRPHEGRREALNFSEIRKLIIFKVGECS